MADEDRFKNSNFAEVFGELETVNGVRRGCFEKFGIPAVLFFLLLFGVATYLGSNDWLTIPLCIGIPFLLFCMVVWQIFSTRRDELKIYENGFTYRSGRNLQACLWREIESYRYRERNAEEITGLPDEEFPLQSVEKKNGEIIGFDENMTGTPEIIRKFENPQAKRKKITVNSNKNGESKNYVNLHQQK